MRAASSSSSSPRESSSRRATVSAMFRSWKALAAMAIAAAAAGCGDLATQGRSPSQLVVLSLAAAPGASPGDFGANLLSDVVTNVQRTENGVQVSSPTIFNDVCSVEFGLVLKDPGSDRDGVAD